MQSQVAVSQGHDHQGAGPLLAPPPSTQPPSLPANASTDANATSASDAPVKRKKGKQKKGRSVKKPPLATSLSSASTGSSVAPPGLQSPFQRPLRVGFVSRFLYNHAIGMLTQGVIQHLPRPKYQARQTQVTPVSAVFGCVDSRLLLLLCPGVCVYDRAAAGGGRGVAPYPTTCRPGQYPRV